MVLALGGAGDDPHRRDLAPVALEDLRLAIGDLGHRGEELVGVHGLPENAADAGRHPLVLGEGLELAQAETAPELGGVAQLHVAVEGEVVGDQRHVVGRAGAGPARGRTRPTAAVRSPFHRDPW